MLQVANGGYTLVQENTSTFIDSLVFYEPGFNLMSPLEFVVRKADTIYILLRKRLNTTSDTLVYVGKTRFSVTATDATNGETIGVRISNNNTHYEWNGDTIPVVIEIESQLDLANPILRVRVIDVKVKDIIDNSFINFRIVVDDDLQYLPFNYIPIHKKAYSERSSFTAASRQAYITLRSDSDFYMIFSPYAWLRETTKELSDFSYPLNTFYYEREKTYNDENYTFALQAWSHEWLEEGISVLNIPGYKKAGIILIDNSIYANIQSLQRSANFTVSVTGELSSMEDTFIVNIST